jgi:hypothetical protein
VALGIWPQLAALACCKQAESGCPRNSPCSHSARQVTISDRSRRRRPSATVGKICSSRLGHEVHSTAIANTEAPKHLGHNVTIIGTKTVQKSKRRKPEAVSMLISGSRTSSTPVKGVSEAFWGAGLGKLVGSSRNKGASPTLAEGFPAWCVALLPMNVEKYVHDCKVRV